MSIAAHTPYLHVRGLAAVPGQRAIERDSVPARRYRRRGRLRVPDNPYFVLLLGEKRAEVEVVPVNRELALARKGIEMDGVARAHEPREERKEVEG